MNTAISVGFGNHSLYPQPPKVISGKEYTGKISKASSFCPVPVNGNGIFIFRNHLTILLWQHGTEWIFWYHGIVRISSAAE